MARQPRELKPNYGYHITTRCNNRDFRLTRFECKEVLLFALKKCQAKYGFKLHGLCIMSNHKKYQPKPKPERKSHWGSQLLKEFNVSSGDVSTPLRCAQHDWLVLARPKSNRTNP